MAGQKEVGVAYGLSFLTFVGIAGIHRFYMGKIGTGIIWLVTLGLLGFGTVYDWFTMSKQVKMVNLLNGAIPPGVGTGQNITVNVGHGAGQQMHNPSYGQAGVPQESQVPPPQQIQKR